MNDDIKPMKASDDKWLATKTLTGRSYIASTDVLGNVRELLGDTIPVLGEIEKRLLGCKHAVKGSDYYNDLKASETSDFVVALRHWLTFCDMELCEDECKEFVSCEDECKEFVSCNVVHLLTSLGATFDKERIYTPNQNTYRMPILTARLLRNVKTGNRRLVITEFNSHVQDCASAIRVENIHGVYYCDIEQEGIGTLKFEIPRDDCFYVYDVNYEDFYQDIEDRVDYSPYYHGKENMVVSTIAFASLMPYDKTELVKVFLGKLLQSEHPAHAELLDCLKQYIPDTAKAAFETAVKQYDSALQEFNAWWRAKVQDNKKLYLYTAEVDEAAMTCRVDKKSMLVREFVDSDTCMICIYNPTGVDTEDFAYPVKDIGKLRCSEYENDVEECFKEEAAGSSKRGKGVSDRFFVYVPKVECKHFYMYSTEDDMQVFLTALSGKYEGIRQGAVKQSEDLQKQIDKLQQNLAELQSRQGMYSAIMQNVMICDGGEQNA